MNKFIKENILEPFKGKWFRGFLLLAFWTISFIALPALSGWFLAICSIVFITGNTLFPYLIPSAIIRLSAIVRTATRYFERLDNHNTTLAAQQHLQLKIFKSVAKFPYFKKQVNNNSTLLENSTHGVDQILNHILLWILPFSTLLVSLVIYFVFLFIFSGVIAIEFLISSSILLFLIPQLVFAKNKKLYLELKSQKEDNNQALIETFRGRIEISKYNLEGRAIAQYEQRLFSLDALETKLQVNSFYLQLILGLGFSYIAALLLYSSNSQGIDAPTATGIFFGIMAQAELAEILFSGKSEKSAVTNQAKDIQEIFEEADKPLEEVTVSSKMDTVTLQAVAATIPETTVVTKELTIDIKKGEWIALYGETGAGKTTFLNSLFYPEYRRTGSLLWNNNEGIAHLPVPECIYVTQKAYLLTGSLRENFEGYADQDIESALEVVDLSSWRASLPDGLDTWLGENSETLSGGQRKKLLLAQALLKKPQLLVVDEPTAGISSENAIAIFDKIRKMNPDMAIFMATHLKEFEKTVDKVVRI